jgi:predicted CXXCH cytochrome family protein
MVGVDVRRRRAVVIAAGIVLVVLAIGTGLGAAQFENRDTFCSSCHSEPERTYVDRSLAIEPTDLASYHTTRSTRCIDCHTGPGLAGRIAGLALGGRDLVRYLIGSYQQPAPLTRPITDSHCTKCHEQILNAQGFEEHFHELLPQWQALSASAATCVSCHSAHTTDGSTMYLNNDRTMRVCQACHAFAGTG